VTYDEPSIADSHWRVVPGDGYQPCHRLARCRRTAHRRWVSFSGVGAS